MFAIAAFTIALASALLATQAGAEGWHSAQPAPPPPSEEQAGIGVPVPLGHIGDIEFWAPNRGLLITAGNEAVPAGLYYYDGVSWHEFSTVCGGTDGRIAWAGPDEFWTISDQQVGQQLGSRTSGGEDRSLCHFVNGTLVASYAEPIGVPSSYQQMDAAACSSASDCWFGGEVLPPGVNSGAFHLHWDGTDLIALPSPLTAEPQLEDPARKVAGITFHQGRFYESVQVQTTDQVPGESSTQPYFLHRIVESSSKPFTPLITEGPLSYGEGVAPSELAAFRFGADERELWAIAGPNGLRSSAHITALLLGAGGFRQLKLSDPGEALAGEEVAGVAAEPGGEDAWV
ncbi:MAG TPA: hypothetical protein VMB05_15630, partial [Solirubrobacteraceae bacterium]|nr:hypothetical protein [Solirubrobacteraceae bacterium]